MKISLPRPPWLAPLRFLLPVATFLAAYWLLGAAAPELTPELWSRATFDATRRVERGWVDQALPADYVATLVVEPPCRLENEPAWSAAAFAAFQTKDESALAELAADHPGSWLPPLLWSQLLIEKGALPRALEVLRRFASGPSYKRLAESRGLPADDQRAMIHLWHRLAYLQLETRSRDPKIFWQSLKNPIGRVKVLSSSGAAGLPKDAPTWDPHRLFAPGCGSTGLSSFDLYNNLLVAYLEVPGFQEAKKGREQEFARAYADPPEQNPWQAALERARQQELGRREGFVWAISNAEKLLRDRRANRLGLPEHPPLAFNLALLSSEAAALVPELQAPFWRQIGSLIDHAAGVGPGPEFAAGLLRLRLLRQIELPSAAALPLPPGALPAWQELAARVAAAAAGRRDPVMARDLLAGGRKPAELGSFAGEWLAALRQDVAAALAAEVSPSAPPAARREAAEQARRVLRGASPPAALTALEESLSLGSRLGAGASARPFRLALALLAAAAVFAAGYVAERELLFRGYLWTSFYRRETEGMTRR